MKVKDFIEWLKTQDQEAIVEIVYHEHGTGYCDQGGNATTQEFDPTKGYYPSQGVAEHWDYTDFRGNQFVKEDSPHYNKRYLLLGAKDV